MTPFSNILKGNTQHYGANTGHGGQFAPRDALAAAATQMGAHAARGTNAPADLKRQVATLRATVEATHGRHISNSVYNDHFASGKAAAHAAQTPAPSTTPVSAPVVTTPVAITPVIPTVPPIVPTPLATNIPAPNVPALSKEEAISNLATLAHTHGSMARYVALQNHAGIHPGLVQSNAKVQNAIDAVVDAGGTREAAITVKNMHMANGIAEMSNYHNAVSVSGSGMTPAEAAGAAKHYTANPPAPTPPAPTGAATVAAPVQVTAPVAVPASPTHTTQVITAQRFTNTTGGHNKFWTVATHGNNLVKHWGAIGTVGQIQVKPFSSPQAAQQQARLMSAAKRASGYADRGASHITTELPVLSAHGTPQAVPQATPVPATPHVPEAVQGVNHPETPVATPTPVVAPQAVQSVEPVDANDPHGLAKLNSPSKIKNAYYDIAHKYFASIRPSSTLTDEAKAALKEKAKAIQDHVNVHLTAATRTNIMNTARSDLDAGIYKLPFKARSPNQSTLPLAAQSSNSGSAPVAVSSPLPLAAQPPKSEKDKLTLELHKMWHQRGRNVADYDSTGIQTQAMKDLREAADKHEAKVKELGVSSSIINAQREIHMNTGKAERKEELKKEDKAKTLLQNAATELGKFKTYGMGFDAAVPSHLMAAKEAHLKANFEKAADIIGHDKATAMREDFLQHGMKEGTKNLQNEAKDRLTTAAHTYGYALGHNGGYGQAPYSQATHDANKAKMMAIHEKAKTILSSETLKSLTTTQVETSKNQGLANFNAEKDTAAKVFKNKVTEHAHAKGVLAATGKAPTAATVAAHKEAFNSLSGIVGQEQAQKIHDASFDTGHAEGQTKLKDALTKASFAMGHHAGKGTTPTPAEKATADQAHAMVKQHIGEEHANNIATTAHEAGKADALHPTMTAAKVTQDMKDLGMESFCNSDFAKSWAANMPKISPREFLTAFLGKDNLNKTNVNKFNSFRFSHNGFYFSGKPGLVVHGAKIDGFNRDFNFSTKTVEHSFLRLQPESQNSGAVKKMFNALMGKQAAGDCLYNRMGMDKAHVHGALDGGGYAWPKFGFHYDNLNMAERHQKKLIPPLSTPRVTLTQQILMR